MKTYYKKNISADEVKKLSETYSLDALTASILLRRNLTTANDIFFLKERALRYTHNPFLFSNMEDAVERIRDALDEGEKILIFGDRDVDGISGTAILFSTLKKLNADVTARIPTGDETYGLSAETIEWANENFISLIITVDCGISNANEVALANDCGIDVIVTDHHNPPEVLPDAYTIVNPKIENERYPFKEISGAGVSYKLSCALRFSETPLYKEAVTLLFAKQTETGEIEIDCMKTRNLVCVSKLTENFFPQSKSISETKLPNFLSGQEIFVWNKNETENLLRECFGSAVEFGLLDFQNECEKAFPSLRGKTLHDLKNLSVLAKYESEPFDELSVFFNLFQTFSEKKFPNIHNEDDLQLAAIAAIADMMSLKNENRIIVREGLRIINSGKLRCGLAELASLLPIAGKPVEAIDISWNIIPALNAAGRVGKSEIALRMLTSENPDERISCAKEIISLNEMRKQMTSDAIFISTSQAEENFLHFEKKLVFVCDEKISKGVTGLVATRLMEKFHAPTIAISLLENGTAGGSMRSCRGVNAVEFLSQFGNDFFANYGGHNFAAGFSFDASKMNEFFSMLEKITKKLSLSDDEDKISLDAELPKNYLTPEISKVLDFFEPTGEGNPPLLFSSHNLVITNAFVMGKTDRQHLKLELDCGKYKFPAIMWGEAEKLGRDINVGDAIDLVYTIGKNTFNGKTNLQMIVSEIKQHTV